MAAEPPSSTHPAARPLEFFGTLLEFWFYRRRVASMGAFRLDAEYRHFLRYVLGEVPGQPGAYDCVFFLRTTVTGIDRKETLTFRSTGSEACGGATIPNHLLRWVDDRGAARDTFTFAVERVHTFLASGGHLDAGRVHLVTNASGLEETLGDFREFKVERARHLVDLVPCIWAPRIIVGGAVFKPADFLRAARYCAYCKKVEPKRRDFNRCGRCFLALYCSRRCQKRDYLCHRATCKANAREQEE